MMKRFLLAALLLSIPLASPARAQIGPVTCPSSDIGPVTCTSTPLPPFVPSCTASQSFFTRAAANIATATAAGGAIAAAVSPWETATDGLICGQVTGGTFALKDVEYLTTAPTIALASMNLVSSSFTLTPGAAMTFSPNAGLTGVASLTGFGDTGYTPSSGQMTTASVLLGACVLNNRTTLMASSFLGEVGTQIASNSFVLSVLTQANASVASAFVAGGASGKNVSSTILPTTQGGFFVARTATNSITAYANSTNLGTAGTALASLTGFGDFLVLGLNNAGTPFSPGGLPDTIGAVILGASETQAQVFADEALFTTALHAVGIASGC